MELGKYFLYMFRSSGISDNKFVCYYKGLLIMNFARHMQVLSRTRGDYNISTNHTHYLILTKIFYFFVTIVKKKTRFKSKHNSLNDNEGETNLTYQKLWKTIKWNKTPYSLPENTIGVSLMIFSKEIKTHTNKKYLFTKLCNIK